MNVSNPNDIIITEVAENHDQNSAILGKRYLLCGTICEISTSLSSQKHYDFLFLSNDDEMSRCKFATNATYDKKMFTKGEKVLLMCSHIENGVNTVFLMLRDSDEYRIKLNEYINKINKNIAKHNTACYKQNPKLPEGFDELPKGLQENILDQLGAPKYDDKDIPTPYNLKGSDYKIKYQICKDTYSPETRRVIEDLLTGYHKKNSDKLKVAMINTRYHTEKISAQEFREELDKILFGLSDAKNKLCSAIATSKRRNNGIKILLVGPPGCGKTELMNATMQLRGKPHFTASCGSLTSLVDTSGDDCLYDSSKPGFFGENFYRMGTTDVTVGLDELDKIPTIYGKDGDPNVCYINMLGDTPYYYDVFSGVKLDCKSTWFIATANDENKIKPFIKNRFDYIIYVNGYTNEEKTVIAKKYIIPQICDKWKIENGEKLITDKLLHYIITEFCIDKGCRELKHNLESIFIKVAELKLNENGHRLSKSMIDEFLNKKALQSSPVFICKSCKSFSDTDRKTIDKIISDSELENDTTGTKEVALQRLNCIADIYRQRDINPTFNLQKFNEDVNKTHYGMETLKRTFARSINYSVKSGQASNLLLVGPPGVGKTTLSKSIADSLNLPFAKISCNGISDPNDLKGVPPHVHAGCCGRIARALCATGLKAFILLDELDKINYGTENGYGIISSFLDLLDTKQYSDTYLGITIDCSDIIFIATANDISRIPPELLDRFETVQLEGYSKVEKKDIFTSKVLPSLLDEIKVKNNEYSFSNDAINYMINNYTETAGVRELKTNAKKILSDIILEHDRYCVEVEDVIHLLGKPNIERGNRPKYNKPGIINALSVNSYSGLGNVFAIETIKSCENKVTGSVRECLAESAEIARAVAASVCKECEKQHYFIHYAEGAVPKDGPSAGVATALSILSCELGIEIPSNYAFTGELDIFGFVWAVGGIKQKIEAAIDKGCTKVFIPKQNYTNMKDELEQFSQRIDIVAVSEIEEITNELFCKEFSAK